MTRQTLKFGLALSVALAFFVPVQAEATPSSKRSQAAIKRQTPELKTSLEKQNLKLGSPVFLRIVKSSNGLKDDGYLQAFVENSEGEFELFRKWDICTYSGKLGPKIKTGDRQAPEGFYYVNAGAMNPYSSYHLSFNLGYPNAYDRAHNRTGSYLMVHGNCVSIGCFAMTDEGIEDIYTLVDAALGNGQAIVRVHSFPFEMTDGNLSRFENHTYHDFWKNLKTGWDWFEQRKRPPNVEVSNKTYVFEDIGG